VNKGGESMAIVKQYISGKTKITIDDMHCVKTQSEIHNILAEVSNLYSQYFTEHPEDYKE
jgi:predicted transcriptional regulator